MNNLFFQQTWFGVNYESKTSHLFNKYFKKYIWRYNKRGFSVEERLSKQNDENDFKIYNNQCA